MEIGYVDLKTKGVRKTKAERKNDSSQRTLAPIKIHKSWINFNKNRYHSKESQSMSNTVRSK